MPFVNGKSAQTAVFLAGFLLALLVACVTLITVTDNVVPQEFSILMSTLAGGLVGFLAGSRVVPPDVSAVIKTEAAARQKENKSILNEAERESVESRT